MRKVDMDCTSLQVALIDLLVGSDNYYRAIGALVSWGHGHYRDLRIVVDSRTGNLRGIYTDGGETFKMDAIYNPNEKTYVIKEFRE